MKKMKNPDRQKQKELNEMSRVRIMMNTGTRTHKDRKRESLGRKAGKRMIREAMGYC